jgi:hypothetical protein
MMKLGKVVSIDYPSVGVRGKEVRYLLPEDIRRCVSPVRLMGDCIER